MAMLHDRRRDGSGLERTESARSGGAPENDPRERLLFVQRGLGNAQASRMIAAGGDQAALLRSPTATAEPDTAAPELTDDQRVATAKEELVQTLADAASQFVGVEGDGKEAPPSAQIPGILTHRLIKGKKLDAKITKAIAKSPLKPLWDALYSEEATKALEAIEKYSTVAKKSKGKEKRVKSKAKLAQNKIALMQAVLERLIPSDEQDTSAQVAAEEAQITGKRKTVTNKKTGATKSVATENFDSLLHEGGDSKWGDVRVSVLVQFGALVDGPKAAIERANAYYGSLVHPTMLGYESNTLVHPMLKARLDIASKTLQDRRDKGEIDDEEWKEIKRATGKGGYWSTNIRANQNAKHRLSDHSFGWAMDILPSENPNVGQGGTALDPVKAVTGDDPFAPKVDSTDHKSSKDVEAAATELRRISQEYEAAMESQTTIDPVLRRLAGEARAAAGLPALAATDADALFEAATQADGDAREKALKAALWPEGSGDTKAKLPAPLEAGVKKLAQVGGAFRASFKKGTSGARAGKSTEAKQGSVAAHGFMSLPPALVAALSGSDAGDLQWLGTSGVHDYMHFQLRSGERPELPTAPPPADDAHAVPQ